MFVQFWLTKCMPSLLKTSLGTVLHLVAQERLDYVYQVVGILWLCEYYLQEMYKDISDDETSNFFPFALLNIHYYLLPMWFRLNLHSDKD